MNLSGIFGAAGAGRMLAAFNPATFFASLAVTAASSAIQQGAGQVASRAGGGFWTNMLSSIVNPFSSKLTDLAQNWLGGADSSKRT